MNFTPLYDRIVVTVIEQDKTEAGLIFTDKNPEMKLGKVIKAGPGRHNDKGIYIKSSIKEGDTVAFNARNGMKVKIEGQEYLMMNEYDVDAVI